MQTSFFFSSGRENRIEADTGLSLAPKSLDGFLTERNKAEQDIKIPTSDFGKHYCILYL